MSVTLTRHKHLSKRKKRTVPVFDRDRDINDLKDQLFCSIALTFLRELQVYVANQNNISTSESISVLILLSLALFVSRDDF